MSKKKILMVDDEPDFLKMVKLNLERTDKFEVLTLFCANEIISHLHSFKPDVVILDLVMPGIGGMEACEMLNRDPLGSSLPILVLSALESERERVLSSGKGIAGYLTKPVTKEELVKKIESLLNLSP